MNKSEVVRPELLQCEDVIYLRGEVSFTSVSGLSNQLHKTMLSNRVSALDCSGITKVDSSIVALLLVALKCAKATGADFSVTKLSPAVDTLIKLYDLEGHLTASA
jgi:phospholipid transport system transporter-binding protein